MDWLRFKFCVFILALYCVSKTQSQALQESERKCVSGELIFAPDMCNHCICFNGEIHCTHIVCSEVNNTLAEQECVTDADLQQPGDCNKCRCHQGRKICSNLICIPDPQCRNGELYPPPDACTECVCYDGFIVCSNTKCKAERRVPQCIEGESYDSQSECTSCKCHHGEVRCWKTCNKNISPAARNGNELAVTTSPLNGATCSRGDYIPKPDSCNTCICFEGHIYCTSLPCPQDRRAGPECVEGQPVIKPDECNECFCFDGRLDCSDLICIRGSKCVEGEVIPKPDACNVCKCFEGHIVCTDFQCNKPKKAITEEPMTAVLPQQRCQEGDIIPSPLPPNDCKRCLCMNRRVFCTIESCIRIKVPDIKGRYKEQNKNEHNLEVFDKQISIEPFINVIFKKYDKTPTKLVHTHAYNGFHQEIKVHSSNLPRDANKLIKVLASSLDNAALGDIGDKIKISSSDVLKNNDPKTYILHGEPNHSPSIPLSGENVQTKHQSFDSSETRLLHSLSSLITSGSRSNETILVIPSTESFGNEKSKSVLSLTKHTQWNSPSTPANIYGIPSRNSEFANLNIKEKMQEYFPDEPPLIISSVEQYKITRNPKFGPPGHILESTTSTRNTVDLSNQPVTPINQKTSTMNDSNVAVAPFSLEDNIFKLTLTSNPPKYYQPMLNLTISSVNQYDTIGNRDDLPHSKFQSTIYDSNEKFPPEQVHKPNASYSIFNVNQYYPPQNVSKPDQQQRISTIDNNIASKPLHSKFEYNLSLYNDNEFYPPQNGLKFNQEQRFSTLDLIENTAEPPSSTIEYDLSIFNDNQIYPPQNELKPNHKQRLLSLDIIENTAKPPSLTIEYDPATYNIDPQQNDFKPDQQQRFSSLEKFSTPEPPHSKFEYDNEIYNVNEFYSPQNELKPKQEQRIYTLNTKESTPKPPSAKIEYNTSTFNINPVYTPQNDFKSDELQSIFTLDTDITKPKSATSNFEYNPVIYNNLLYPLQNGLKPDKEQHISTLNTKESTLIPPSTNIEYNPISYNINTVYSPQYNVSEFYPTQNGSKSNQDQHISNLNITASTPIPSLLKTEDFDMRGSSDGFQYMSNFTEDPKSPKVIVNSLPQSQSKIPQSQLEPGIFDDRSSSGEFQYISHSDEEPQYKPHQSQFEHKREPESVTDREIPNEFQLESSVEEVTIFKTKHIELPQSRLIPQENQLEPMLVPIYDHPPLKPRIEPDHDQYKPLSVDTLLNGVHNMPWSFPDEKNTKADTSTPPTLYKLEQDLFKPSSIDNLPNGFHQITWHFPKKDKKELSLDVAPLNSQPRLKTDEDQLKPSSIELFIKQFNISLPKPNQNQKIPTLDKEKDSLTIDLINSDTKQYELIHPRFKPELDKDNLFSLEDDRTINLKKQLYTLLMTVKKLIKSPPKDDPDYAVRAIDKELDLLSLLFPTLSKNITIKTLPDQEQYTSSVESFKIIKEFITPGNNTNTMPDDDDKEVKTRLFSNPNKSSTTIKQHSDKLPIEDIEINAKISNIFSNIPPPQIKPVPELQTQIQDNTAKPTLIPLTKQYLSTESTSNYDYLLPKVSEESRFQRPPPVNYPDIHIIVHQRNTGKDGTYVPYIENDAANHLNDVTEEELDSFYLPKLLHSRSRYRSKDQKEECGEGTKWTSNCHTCSCQGGLAVCYKLSECVFRSLSEPMTCKPYSTFKMGECYDCECNGDGVAECEATDCKTESSSEDEDGDSDLPMYKDSVDGKKSVELLRYYKFYKKLPQDCSLASLNKYPTCEAGTTWVSNCHQCECNENGQHECTKIDDCEVDEASYGKPARCKPNTKFYPKTTNLPCGECICDDEGNPHCPGIDYKKH